MDAWSEEQLKKMQAGGNGSLNDFFKQYGVDKYSDIREKYNNRVAEVRMCCAGCPAVVSDRWPCVCWTYSARLFVSCCWWRILPVQTGNTVQQTAQQLRPGLDSNSVAAA